MPGEESLSCYYPYYCRNGIAGTVKTAFSEMVADDTTGTMGMVVGMRAWGFLMSPAVGGWLAEPITQYPLVFAENTRSLCYRVLEKYPFILPNLFGSLLCLGTALADECCIPETLPSAQLQVLHCSPTCCIDLLGVKKLHCRQPVANNAETTSLWPPSNSKWQIGRVEIHWLLRGHERHSERRNNYRRGCQHDTVKSLERQIKRSCDSILAVFAGGCLLGRSLSSLLYRYERRAWPLRG